MKEYVLVAVGQLIDTNVQPTQDALTSKIQEIEASKSIPIGESAILTSTADGTVSIRDTVLQAFQQEIVASFRVNGFAPKNELSQQETNIQNARIFREKTYSLLGITTENLSYQEFDEIWVKMCVVEQTHADRIAELLKHPNTILHSGTNVIQAEHILAKLQTFSVEIPRERLFLSYEQECEYQNIQGQPSLIHKIYSALGLRQPGDGQVLLIQGSTDRMSPVFQQVATDRYNAAAKTATALLANTIVVSWNNNEKDEQGKAISLIRYLRNNYLLTDPALAGLCPHLYLRQESSIDIQLHLKATCLSSLEHGNSNLASIIDGWNFFIELIILYKNDQPAYDFKYTKPDSKGTQKFSDMIIAIDGKIEEFKAHHLLERYSLLAVLYNLKSSVLRNLNRYEEALKSCVLAQECLSQESNILGKAIIFSNMAGIYNAYSAYASGLTYSAQAYELIKAQILGDGHKNEFNKKIMGCIASIYGYSVRKTKDGEADAVNAADIQRKARQLYSSSNIILNNLAISLTKASDVGCQKEAISLLSVQLQFDQTYNRYLFVTPYYLADAYIRLAFLEKPTSGGQVNQKLIEEAQIALKIAEDALAKNHGYDGAYKGKAQARVARLHGVICSLLGDRQAAEQYAVTAKTLMFTILGESNQKLSDFKSKVDDSIRSDTPKLFFNRK